MSGRDTESFRESPEACCLAIRAPAGKISADAVELYRLAVASVLTVATRFDSYAAMSASRLWM